MKHAFRVAELTSGEGRTVGRTKFYQEVKAGRIKVRKIGRASIVLSEDWQAYLRNLPEQTDPKLVAIKP